MMLIEGVGGVMVPLGPRHTVLDWITALETATLLVVGSYLGTLSHTLTAVEALRARGIEPVGIVISESEESPVPLSETRATLSNFLPSMMIATMDRAPMEDGDCLKFCQTLQIV